MSRARTVGKGAGVAAAALGVVAAGAATGLALERYAVDRMRQRPDPEADEPFGRLPVGRTSTVPADDGVPLYVEEAGDLDAPLAVVLCHGWALDMGCWHYQRQDLAGDLPGGAPVGRVVLYDQRSHGRSGRSPREHATIDQLGRDLYAVLQAVVPAGPVVLVGQSMGGMTIMALADAHPELFGSRVAGVALLSTSTGQLAELTLGLPSVLARGLRRLAPGVLEQARRRSALVERGRALGSDLQLLATRWYAFGDDVSPSVVRLMERMVSATPVDVVADFYGELMNHDKLAALPVLRDVETLVVVGDADKLTPVRHSRSIADGLPDAELLVVPGAGHMVMLEAPQQVNAALRALVRRAAARAAARRSATRRPVTRARARSRDEPGGAASAVGT